MNRRGIIIGLSFIVFSYTGFTQPDQNATSAERDTTTVNNLLQQSKDAFVSDPEKAIQLSHEAKTLAHEINFPKGEALAYKNIGLFNNKSGKPIEALENYNQSIKLFEQISDYSGLANVYSNMGVVYYIRGDDARALENYLNSLKYSELAGDKFRVFIALNNIGGVYYDKVATYDKALQYYLRALPLCEELGKIVESGLICVNIGSVYHNKNEDEKALFYFNKALKAYGDNEGSLDAYNGMGKLYRKEGKYDLALKNHNQALAMARQLNNKIAIVQSLMGLGNVYMDKGDYKTALKYYSQAEIPAVELRVNHELKDLYEDMALAYSKINDFGNAFTYEHLFSSIKDTLYNIDTDKKLGTLQFDFDLQKKQGEINLLTKDKALTDLQLNRQRLAKRALMVGLVLIFLIALLTFRNYRAKVKTNKILDRQKDEIEQLLLNILPSEVATELQTSGKSKPRHFEEASVLFTDFKGFTSIADKLSPEEVVEELNECFMAFDSIMEKHDLEKIKTIGDAYMCAGNIPSPDPDHAYKIIKAAMEIQGFVEKYNISRAEKGLEAWEIRIGVHIGPVVAGVVGKKKYAYDIWGSTVNIASRMESNGTPGRVNISAATYEMIKDRFECSHRGKIYAKNLGDLDMYFVEYEKSLSGIQIIHSADKAEQHLEQ